MESCTTAGGKIPFFHASRTDLFPNTDPNVYACMCVYIVCNNDGKQLRLLSSLCWPSAQQHPGKLSEQTVLISGRCLWINISGWCIFFRMTKALGSFYLNTSSSHWFNPENTSFCFLNKFLFIFVVQLFDESLVHSTAASSDTGVFQPYMIETDLREELLVRGCLQVAASE